MGMSRLSVLAPFVFATFLLALAGAATISLSSSRLIMDAGQNSIMNVTVSGGYGVYSCAWSYYNFANGPSDAIPFGNSNCTTTFYGNNSDKFVTAVIDVSVSNDTSNIGSSSAQISIKPYLDFTIYTTQNVIYAGNSISISNSTENFTTDDLYSGSPPYSYSYTVPNGVVEDGNGFYFPIPGIYAITETVQDSDDNMVSESVNITVLPVPIFVTLAAPYSTLELGQSEVITARGREGVPPYSYEWFVNNQEEAYGPSNTFLFAPNSVSSYQVYAQISDPYGDTNDSQTLDIDAITPVSTVLKASPSLISAGQSVQLTNNTIGGMEPYSYAYAFSSQNGVTQSGNAFTFNSPGNYIVTLSVSDALGGFASSNAEVTVTAPLEVTLSANTEPITTGQTVDFKNVTSGGTGSDVYSYSVSPSNGVTEKGNNFTFNSAGNYLVTLMVSDISGETASSGVKISVLQPTPSECSGNNKGPALYITGSSISRTVEITNQSAVYITGSSNNVTIEMPGSNCDISVVVTGSSNKVNVYNGTISLSVTGSSNYVILHNTVISQQCITGSSNKVTGGIINGKSFTVTGSSDLVESFQVENLDSFQITGSSTDITLTMLTSNALQVSITGSSNILYLIDGKISLTVTGSDNTVYYDDTTITSKSIVGSGNKVTSD